ncbi:MAG: isoprenylcysteine carboxylmethyltransferase family protein [Actinomycetota bacterium]
MDVDLRQLAVLILLSIAVLIRLFAHQQAGGIQRDQSDGVALEGGAVIAVGLRLVFLVGGLGGTIAWLISPDLIPGSIDLPAWAHWFGIALAETGVVLLAAVHVALGVHFSGTLHLREDHQLVRSGPYARIRHPMYTSFLLLFVGLSLVMANVPLAVLMLSSQAWVIGWRLPIEEAQLADRFGHRWDEYRAGTGALVPTLSAGRRGSHR